MFKTFRRIRKWELRYPFSKSISLAYALFAVALPSVLIISALALFEDLLTNVSLELLLAVLFAIYAGFFAVFWVYGEPRD